MRSSLPLLTACLAVQVALVACGGIAAAPADGGSTSSSGGSASGGASGSGSGGTSSSGASSGGPNADGGSSGSSSGGADAGSGDTSVDAPASFDATADVVSVPDAPPPAASVSCPQDLVPATCNAGQYCCVVGDGHAGTQSDTCEDDGAKCAGTPVRCSTPSDCPAAQVCCGTEQLVDGGAYYVDVTCAASCSGANQRVFCDPLSNTCPVAHPTCALSTILPGYHVCNQ